MVHKKKKEELKMTLPFPARVTGRLAIYFQAEAGLWWPRFDFGHTVDRPKLM